MDSSVLVGWGVAVEKRMWRPTLDPAGRRTNQLSRGLGKPRGAKFTAIFLELNTCSDSDISYPRERS